jgi:hypothetical protein
MLPPFGGWLRMRLRVFLAAASAVAVALGADVASAATIYNVNLAIGAADVTGTITTDGRLGSLDGSDILSFDLLASHGSTKLVFNSAVDGELFANVPSALSAIGNELSFDYGASGQQFLIFTSSGLGDFCVYTQNACGTVATGNQVLFPAFRLNDENEQLETGVQAIATAVPEPTTWALLMMGIGILGFALRSERRTLVHLSRGAV